MSFSIGAWCEGIPIFDSLEALVAKLFGQLRPQQKDNALRPAMSQGKNGLNDDGSTIQGPRH